MLSCHRSLSRLIAVPATGLPSSTNTCASFSTTESLSRVPRCPPSPWELYNKQNMKSLVFHNKAHLRQHKKMLFKRFGASKDIMPDIPRYDYGCRSTGLYHNNFFESVAEMEPELVVPDLDGFKLKPYVSYKTKEIYQEPLTSYDLFNVTYGKEILRRYNAAKESGNTEELEKLEKEELKFIEDPEGEARRTGADKFRGGVERPLFRDVRWERQRK